MQRPDDVVALASQSVIKGDYSTSISFALSHLAWWICCIERYSSAAFSGRSSPNPSEYILIERGGRSMANVDANIAYWGQNSSWKNRGDEWSEAWGSPENQWEATVYPRIKNFLPVSCILEIAPGFGRWTEFLRRYCDRLIGVDLNENCIRGCEERFRNDPRLSFHQNDGVSLKFVADASVDLIFSFDSLVHAECDVIEGYFAQFPRILRPNGVAFIHHSNFGACGIIRPSSKLNHVPMFEHYLRRTGLTPSNFHWRARNVSAKTVRAACKRQGLRCVQQETINWGGSVLNDCFSLIARGDSTLSDGRLVANPSFMEEARRIKNRHQSEH